MIKVLIFNNTSRAAGYGVGTYIKNLVEGLSSRENYTISIIEMYSNSKEFCIERDDKNVIHFKIPGLQNNIESELYCRITYYLVARHLSISDNDKVIFLFNYYQHLPLALLFKGQFPDSSIVFTVHYFNWCFEMNGNSIKFHRLLLKCNDNAEIKECEEKLMLDNIRVERRFLYLADKVITLSRRTMRMLINDYKVSADKIHVVYNGLGCDLKQLDKFYSKHKYILFVGRLDQIKGLKYLISAFGQISSKYPNAILQIAGDGDFKPYIEQSKRLSDKISFLGKVNTEELETVYKTAYMGVIPSFHEQCSYTVIEMMRYGLPIVGTDTTGLSEMLDVVPEMRVTINEDYFNEDDFINSLAFKIELLLSDKNLYNSISEKLKRQYIENYTSTSMLKKTQNIIEQSFNKINTISYDYLTYIDQDMMNIINKRPNIDIDFFGMSGVGVYLWWRCLCIKDDDKHKLKYASILEYLIYYLDWLDESSTTELLPQEMVATLLSMKSFGFYKSVVLNLLSRQIFTDICYYMPAPDTIIKNSMRICNCKI